MRGKGQADFGASDFGAARGAKAGKARCGSERRSRLSSPLSCSLPRPRRRLARSRNALARRSRRRRPRSSTLARSGSTTDACFGLPASSRSRCSSPTPTNAEEMLQRRLTDLLAGVALRVLLVSDKPDRHGRLPALVAAGGSLVEETPARGGARDRLRRRRRPPLLRSHACGGGRSAARASRLLGRSVASAEARPEALRVADRALRDLRGHGALGREPPRHHLSRFRHAAGPRT